MIDATALLALAPRAALSSLPPVVASIAAAAAPWKDFYGDSKVAETAVLFAHLGALLVGGGLAIAADRATLRAVRGGRPLDTETGVRARAELASTHVPVVVALAVVFASGALLFLSDVETFWGSPVYWAKMSLVALLLVNGFLMTRTERALAAASPGEAAPWGRLRVHAVASLALWLVTMLAGVALANS